MSKGYVILHSMMKSHSNELKPKLTQVVKENILNASQTLQQFHEAARPSNFFEIEK